MILPFHDLSRAVFLWLFLLLPASASAQQSQETQGGNQTASETVPTGGAVSSAATNATGAKGRGPDFTWVVPVEFKGLPPNLAKIDIVCVACTDDCKSSFCNADETETVSKFYHSFEFPNPAPRNFKQTLTIHSDAGTETIKGYPAKLQSSHPSGTAANYLCGILSFECHADGGKRIHDSAGNICAQQKPGTTDEIRGKISS